MAAARRLLRGWATAPAAATPQTPRHGPRRRRGSRRRGSRRRGSRRRGSRRRGSRRRGGLGAAQSMTSRIQKPALETRRRRKAAHFVASTGTAGRHRPAGSTWRDPEGWAGGGTPPSGTGAGSWVRHCGSAATPLRQRRRRRRGIRRRRRCLPVRRHTGGVSEYTGLVPALVASLLHTVTPSRAIRRSSWSRGWIGST